MSKGFDHGQDTEEEELFTSDIENGNTSTGEEEVASSKRQAPDMSLFAAGLNSGFNMLSGGNNQHTKYVKEFIKEIPATLEDLQLDISALKITSEKYDILFTYILFAHKAKNNRIYYYSIVLEKTGIEPRMLSDIMSEREAVIMNGKGGNNKLITTADAFDPRIVNIFEKVLIGRFGNNPIVCLDGEVIPSDSDVEETSRVVTRFAHDLIFNKVNIDTGVLPDVSLAAIKEFRGDKYLKVELSTTFGNTVNRVGKAVKTDFVLEASVVSNEVTVGMDVMSSVANLTYATGYMDFVISPKPVPNQVGVDVETAKPIIILNEFLGAAPTLRYTLLSLINAFPLTNPNLLSTLIMEKDAGPLNYKLNYGGEGHIGQRFSFKDTGADQVVIKDFLNKHFDLDPLFALEIELYGPDFAFSKDIVGLSNPKTVAQANLRILKEISGLLNNVKLPKVGVELVKGTLVPIGEFVDSDGNTRDAREIDAVFINNNTNDPKLVDDWNFSNFPAEACMLHTQKTPLEVKLDVWNKLSLQMGIKIKITGVAYRAIINDKLIRFMAEVAITQGYAPNISAPGISNVNNMQVVSQAYNSSIGNLGFGQVNSGGNTGYNGFAAQTGPISYGR